MFSKKSDEKNFAHVHENICNKILILVELLSLKLNLKRTLLHLLFPEFWKIFQNAFFTEHLCVAASASVNTFNDWIWRCSLYGNRPVMFVIG